MPKINTIHTCCVGLHTPKTHAVIVYRPNFEDPHYCDYYFIPGDSGIQERCSKLNTTAAYGAAENKGKVGRAGSTIMVLNA